MYMAPVSSLLFLLFAPFYSFVLVVVRLYVHTL